MTVRPNMSTHRILNDGKMEKSPEMSAGVEYLIIYEDICLRSIILSVRGVVGEKLILLPN